MSDITNEEAEAPGLAGKAPQTQLATAKPPRAAPGACRAVLAEPLPAPCSLETQSAAASARGSAQSARWVHRSPCGLACLCSPKHTKTSCSRPRSPPAWVSRAKLLRQLAVPRRRAALESIGLSAARGSPIAEGIGVAVRMGRYPMYTTVYFRYFRYLLINELKKGGKAHCID